MSASEWGTAAPTALANCMSAKHRNAVFMHLLRDGEPPYTRPAGNAAARSARRLSSRRATNDRARPISCLPVGLWMNAATALTMENRRKIANIAVALSPAVKWLFC